MEISYGLIKKYDTDVARRLCLGARTASSLTTRAGGRTGGFAGSGLPTWDGSSNKYGVDDRLRNANARTDAAVLRGLISVAAETLDEDDVPDDDDMRYCALRPAQYHLMVRSPGVEVNRDYGGMGSSATGYIPMIDNVRLVKTNHLPIADYDATADDPNGPLSGTIDYGNTTALVWHAAAAGTVQLIDVTYESEYTAERQATLILGKYAFGHGLLRPECVREITNWGGV